ncbi:MAG: hypothetical protein ABSF98_24905, partial [Bryobacteraceae bacterium]
MPRWSLNALTAIVLLFGGALAMEAGLPLTARVLPSQDWPGPGNRAARANRPAASSTQAPMLNVSGTWIDSLGYTWTLTQDQSGNVSGNADFLGSGCICGKGECGGSGHSPIWPVSGHLAGRTLTITATNPASGALCTTYVEYTLTITADGIAAAGSYAYAAGSGSVSMSLTAGSTLPQFVFGGGWYSALYFTNLTGAAVSFPVSFVSDAGTPLTVPALGGPTTQVNLAAHGTAI